MRSPAERFLGVNETANAFTLLALTPGQTHPKAVQRALESQLARIDRHPDSKSPEARLMRERLHAAARAVLTGEPQFVGESRPSTPPPSPPAKVQVRPTGAQQAAKDIDRPSGGSQPKPPRPTQNLPTPAIANAPPVMPRAAPFSVPPAGRLELTPFDRQVLAILIASGGWNAESRSRLVSLAMANHVSPTGLMKVVRGLSDYAGSHASVRLDAAQILGAGGLGQRGDNAEPLRLDPALGQTNGLSRHVEWRANAQHEEQPIGSTWATVKLSVLFGGATLLLGILFVRLLMEPDSGVIDETLDRRSQNSGIATPVTPELRDPSTGAGRDDRIEPGGRRVEPLLLASWPQPPTFTADPASPESARAADRSPRLPGLFDELARRLTVTDHPDGSFFELWRERLEEASIAWPLMDRTTLQQTNNAALGVLMTAADRPSVIDRLLGALHPVSESISPLDLWRGAWSAGMLGAAAGRPDAPATLREGAAVKLASVLAQPIAADARTFEGAARAWLKHQTARLVEIIEFDESSYQQWELWLTALRTLSDGLTFDAHVMDAVEALLATSTDLGRPSRSVNVLGRLLRAADFQRSVVVRDRLLRLYDNEHVDSRDVWVVASLLAQYDAASWFDRSYVPRDTADMSERRLKRQLLESAWPQLALTRAGGAAAGRGVVVEPSLGARWRAVADNRLRGMSGRIGDPVELLIELLHLVWLNETAAALASQDHRSAREGLRLLDAGWHGGPSGSGQPDAPDSPPGGLPRRPPPPGTPHIPHPDDPRHPAGGGREVIGRPLTPDGSWSGPYEHMRQPQERVEHIRSLRSTPAGDLGPMDSRIFVREVLRGAPESVRQEAQSVLLEMFARGPNVAYELLNQFNDAPRTGSITESVARLTGAVIPDPNSSRWEWSCRRALAVHAVGLRDSKFNEIDDLQSALAESYANQFYTLRPMIRRIEASTDPSTALERVVSAFRDHAAGLIIADPIPAPLAAIERQHATRLSLAEGPIERAVASQITLLDLLAYITTAEQPVMREKVMEIRHRGWEQRAAADHILEQALVTEATILELWRMRLIIEAPTNDRSTRHEGESGSAETHSGIRAWGSGNSAQSPVPSPLLQNILLSARFSTVGAVDWTARLEALDPGNPTAYFDLAEEVADQADTAEDRELARHLFRLAGVLDSDRLGRSACLALADLADSRTGKRRYLALAQLLDGGGMLRSAGGALGPQDRSGMAPNWLPGESIEQFDASSAVMLSRAFGYYRVSRGRRALEILRNAPAAANLFERHGDVIGGVRRFTTNAEIPQYNDGQSSPLRSERAVTEMLELEAALLSADDPTWAMDLMLHGGRTLIEADPTRIASTFGVDARLVYYRGGRWVSRP